MLSRRLLVSTCLFALCATPALPQGAQNMGQAPQAAAQTALSPPPNMRAALRAWGLDRQRRGTQFTKGAVTDTRAQFSALSFSGTDGKRTTLDNLTIARETAAGPLQGTFSIQIDRLAESDGSRVSSILITGVRGGADLVQTLSALSLEGEQRQAGTRRPDAGLFQAETMSFRDVSTSLASGGTTTNAQIAFLDMTGVRFNAERFSFESLILRDGTFDDKSFVAKFKDMNVRGISSDDFARFTNLDTPQRNMPNILTLAVGHFSINGLSYSFKGENNKPPPLNTFSIDRFAIDDIKDGFMGRFSLGEVKFNGGIGSQAWEGGLTRLNMSGINMRYFSELGKAFAAGFANAIPKPPGNPDKPAPTPAPAPPTTSGPKLLLSDLVKGGPLDGGVAAMDIAGISASAAGYEFSIDQIGLSQVRNANDIVTQFDLLPMTARLKVPAEGGAESGMIRSVLTKLGTEDFSLRVQGKATYDPGADLMNMSNYQMDIGGIGGIKMAFSASGMMAMMSQVSVDDIIAASTPKRGASGTGPAAAKESLLPLLNLYRSIKVNSARAEIIDAGGLNFMVQTLPAPGNRRPPANGMTRTQIQEARAQWAQAARDTAGNKNQPPLLRSLAISAARWMENGGSLVFQANPTTPRSLTDLAGDRAPSPTDWGVRISHATPTRN
jgi:hypothetical protein